MAVNKRLFRHDKGADVLYVSFGLDEPSFCEDFTDFILIERGIFTKLPTGLRVINFSKHADELMKELPRIRAFVLDKFDRFADNQATVREELDEERFKELLHT